MKLKNKIQNSMTLVVMTTLLIAYVITTFVVYRQTLHLMENEIHQEADYIKTAIEKTGESYLKEMDDVRRTTRVTLIARDGTVLYDSGENAIERENHKNRPEIKRRKKAVPVRISENPKPCRKKCFIMQCACPTAVSYVYLNPWTVYSVQQ